MEILGMIIGSVGGGILGATLMSFALNCGGLRDCRLYLGIVGFLLALLGIVVSKL